MVVMESLGFWLEKEHVCQETGRSNQWFGTEGGADWLLWFLGKNHNYPNGQDGCVDGGREKKSHEIP